MLVNGGDELGRALRAWAAASPENRAVLQQLLAVVRGALESAPDSSESDSRSQHAVPSPAHVAEGPAAGPPEPPVVHGPRAITGPRLAPEYARSVLSLGLGNAITREVGNGAPAMASERRDVAPDGLDRETLARRFDIKARCCAFLMERDEASRRGESLWNFQKERYEAIMAEAAACDARLWMKRAWEDGVDEAHAIMLVNAFKNLAQAMELIEEEDPAAEVLELVAEAQSAVRALCEDMDSDQTRVFMWLRQQTDRRRIFLRRYMADSTRADPANWSDLRERLTMTLQKRRADADRERLLKKPLQRAAYHARKIEGATARGVAPEAEDWNTIVRALDAYVAAGGSLESSAWLDAIAPAGRGGLDQEGVPGALRESLTRALARGAEAEEDASLRGWERNPAPELAKVRAFLRGREIVLVGGTRRALAETAIIEAFELSGVRWLDFGEHKSLELFKPDVARPEVVLVLAMIRFMSHAYDDLREVCQRNGKLYARLKGGYSPNQIATQVWEQLSAQIEAEQRVCD